MMGASASKRKNFKEYIVGGTTVDSSQIVGESSLKQTTTTMNTTTTLNTSNSSEPKNPNVQFFIDTSGSTTGCRNYYETVKRLLESCDQEETVEIFEWATGCAQLTRKEALQAVLAMKHVKVDAGATNLFQIVEHINVNASSIIISTDGAISCSDYELTIEKLKSLKSSSTNRNPKIKLFVLGSIDDSIILALGSSGWEFEFSVNDRMVDASGACKDATNLGEFIKSINLACYSTDANYKQNVDLVLRFSTVGASVDLIQMAKSEVGALKQRTLGVKHEVDATAFSTAIYSNDMSAVEKLFMHAPRPTEPEAVERATSQLMQIIANYCDKRVLYFTKTPVCENIVPETDVYDIDPDTQKLPPGTIECFFSSQVGVPYVSFTLEKPLEIDRAFLKQLIINPLLITSICPVEKAFGAFFCNDPSKFCDGRDPKTRANIVDADGTTRVLALGTDQSHIEYSDKIIFRVLFNDYMVTDPDLVFLAIWYQLKYKSSRDDLKELVPCFEAQLRVRFEKVCPLSLCSNVFEMSHIVAKKWMCVWFIVHELPYFKQNDQNHSSTVRFLSKIYMFEAFLKDLYNLPVAVEVSRYLADYLALKQLIRRHNTSDSDEFWRRIRALELESISIDAKKSIVPFGKDLNAKMLGGKVVFGEECASVDPIFENRKATIVTIPLDKERTQRPSDELLSYFPQSLHHNLGKLRRLCCHISNERSRLLMFNEAENLEIQRQNALLVYYYCWSYRDFPTDLVKIHPKTLRPYTKVDDKNWEILAQEILGPYQRFVSVNHLIAQFIRKYKKLPSEEDMLLYIYKVETSKEVEVVFVDGKLEKLKRPPNLIFTLPHNIVQSVKEMVKKFRNIIAVNNVSFCGVLFYIILFVERNVRSCTRCFLCCALKKVSY